MSHFKSLVGENTEVIVHYDYQPHEPETKDSPEWGPHVDITGVLLLADDSDGEGILGDLSGKCVERLSLECHAQIEED